MLQIINRVIISLLFLACFPLKGITQAYWHKGLLSYERGNLTEAIELWQREINLRSPMTHAALLSQAQAYLDLGNLVEAQRILSQSFPASFFPYHQSVWANYLIRVGDFDGAIAIFNEIQFSHAFDHLSRLTLFNNYIQALLEREKSYQNQLKAELDPQQRQILRALTQNDRAKALEVATVAYKLAEQENLLNTENGIDLSITLASLTPDLVDADVLEQRILALLSSANQVKFLLLLTKIKSSSELYTKALTVAQYLQQPRLLSWAWGEWGAYLFRQGNYEQALVATYQAQAAANDGEDWAKLAQWLFQSAKIQQSLGNFQKSRQSYQLAASSIQKLRSRLAGHPINPLLAQSIEPILQGYLEVLLINPSSADLVEALKIQQLRLLTELDSYFKSVCELNPSLINQIPDNTALVNSIVLENKIYLIIQTSQKIYSRVIYISQSNLNQQVYDWYSALTFPNKDAYIQGGEFFYNLLIHPIENELPKTVSRLVFIHDGVLRTLPMSALIDENNNKYLIEKYTISYSLGLISEQFISPLSDFNKPALIVGRVNDKNLTGIQDEVIQLSKLLKGEILINQDFSANNLLNKLQQQDYSIVHLATHNQIGRRIEETRLSTGVGTVSLKEFENIFRQRSRYIALLTLSACDTAKGNQFAVLGLTGLGVRAGIPSVLGTLWTAPDKTSTNLMTTFYQSFLAHKDLSKALQEMQIEAIRLKQRPFYWAGFVLVNN
ncbi:Tetratricopeptide TPR_4 (plasmid) [Gloeothece citriformis PCC 7424]|uniref:Tetratricopeptide TPR_4 n=1 Tax=Gloeothece citriformis (strain PCC 7424) TaxID=65393 RepID=B7KLP6_GLOC7|nr:CHAT domain-containing protein [Gloeothece citriformis]ACK73718.1 Tetratricopeptide TPR_4 [Gloeothece citriformis PCC 7424]